MIENLIVTGGSGYIGNALITEALNHGINVIALGRKRGINDIETIPWSLGQELPSNLPNLKNSALVHLAHDWSNTEINGQNLNTYGSEILFKSAYSKGIVRLIFISSQSARIDAPNKYGRTKWSIEQLIEKNYKNSASVRIGLVYGGSRAGMYGLLRKIVGLLPIIPMIRPKQKVQPIHVKEVCDGILAICSGSLTGWHGLASPNPISFREFLETLARQNFGKKIIILPIPLGVALLGHTFLSCIPFIPKIDKERILGLAGTKVMDNANSIKALNLEVLPMHRGLQLDFCKYRGILIEARTLLKYLQQKKTANVALMKRYARASIVSNNTIDPISISSLLIAFPFLIKIIEPIKLNGRFGERLKLATLVFCSSNLIEIHKTFRVSNILYLSFSIFCELLIFPIRVALNRVRNDKL